MNKVVTKLQNVLARKFKPSERDRESTEEQNVKKQLLPRRVTYSYSSYFTSLVKKLFFLLYH